jgi:hypothetical protein
MLLKKKKKSGPHDLLTSSHASRGTRVIVPTGAPTIRFHLRDISEACMIFCKPELSTMYSTLKVVLRIAMFVVVSPALANSLHLLP